MGIPDERAWRQLFEAALLELNPDRLIERIQAARTTIRDRIEGSLSKTPEEHVAMRDALTTLDSLAKTANRDLDKQ
jgi:hypothetical protein